MTVAMPRIFSLLPQTARSSSSLSCCRSSLQFGDEPVFLDGVLDGDVERDFPEPLGIVRLDDVVGGAEPDGLDDRRGLVAAGQHDDLRLGPRGFQRAERGQPIEARHHDVEQDDVGRLGLFHRGEQFVPARVATRFIPAQRKKRPQIVRQTTSRRRQWRRRGSSSISLQRSLRPRNAQPVGNTSNTSPTRMRVAFKNSYLNRAEFYAAKRKVEQTIPVSPRRKPISSATAFQGVLESLTLARQL